MRLFVEIFKPLKKVHELIFQEKNMKIIDARNQFCRSRFCLNSRKDYDKISRWYRTVY